MPRERSRHRPTPPRSPANSSRTYTPSPNTGRRNVLNTRTPGALPPDSRPQTREQTNQPTLVSLSRTPQNPSHLSANQRTEFNEPTQTNGSRPPTPNWPGFAPPPNQGMEFNEPAPPPNQGMEFNEPTDRSRPPTPNWPGFAPPPNFREAREQAVHDADATPPHHSHYSRIWNRQQVVAMEPLSIDNDYYLDYRDAQNIKFFNKGREKLPGEPFSGKNILSWLRRLEIKATEFHWISTLTIDGKLLTTHFAELSMERVKAAAQEIQDEAQRRAQNSRMLLYCITASVTPQVMDRLALKNHLFTLQVRGKSVQDGVCMLKVLIDCYYASTRYTTIEIRKQLASLPTYMQTVAKGDVAQLCEHTRKLNAELEAAGERTLDLVANLLAALETAPNPVFQRWLEGRKNLWALRQIEWKDDGTDLMDEAEAFFLNLRENRSWKKHHSNEHRVYALQACESSVTSNTSGPIEAIKSLADELKAFSAIDKRREQKYRWKYTPPKDGESTSKRMLIDGVKRKYNWCVHHRAWVLHSPQECRRSGGIPHKRRSPNKTSSSAKRKKIQEQARVALEALALWADSNNSTMSSDLETDSNQDSNYSFSDSEVASQATHDSYRTADYDTDES